MPIAAPWNSVRRAPAPWRQNWQDCLGLPSPRRRRLVQLSFVGLAGLSVLNCATSGKESRRSAAAEVGVPEGASGSISHAGELPRPELSLAVPMAGGEPGQFLLRAEISGDEGSGSLRLRLLRLEGGRFALSVADALGQERWEIRRDRDAAIWLDAQGHSFCHLDARLPLRARLWVSSIPLADLPGLLTGEWPPEGTVTYTPSLPGAGEQKVTGERDEGGWVSWTLWEGGEPVAWWKRLGPDSLLSLRRPAVQVRWRVTAQSGLDLSPGAIAKPGWGTPSGTLSANEFLLPGELRGGLREIACPDNAIP